MNDMKWWKIALHWTITEAVRGFESLGNAWHRTAGRWWRARCHGDCVARFTDIQGRKKCYQMYQNQSHTRMCLCLWGVRVCNWRLLTFSKNPNGKRCVRKFIQIQLHGGLTSISISCWPLWGFPVVDFQVINFGPPICTFTPSFTDKV